MRVELPRWTIYERGSGGSTKRAARAWLAGSPLWQAGKTDVVRRYFDAGGNGVAMRVLPHALFLAGQDDPAVLVHDVVRDGAATHGHPRALVGATDCAYATWSLVRRNGTLGFGELLDLLIDERDGWGAFPDMERGGAAWFAAASRVFDEPYELLWERTVDEVRQLLEQARTGIRAGALAEGWAVLDNLGCFGRFKGAGTVTADATACLAARHAAQPAQGVLRAAFEWGADTDTLAAVTGRLLGCLAGDEWLPGPWRDVQDAPYLRCIAGRIAQGPAGAEQRPVETPPVPRAILTDLARNGDHEVALGESTRAQATALPNPKPLSKSITESGRLYRAGRVKAEPTSVRQPPSDSATSKSDPATPAPADAEAGVAVDRGDALYGEFRRQLRTLLSNGPARPKRIEEALGFTSLQARRWLERMERGGEIERASSNPVTYALTRKTLL